MFTANDAIDIWIVERALGQGGMGSVYRCHNRDAKRILAAIKVLDYGLKRSPKARARFVREAEILFALDHPNIVKMRNVRLDADPPYLEMEFVEGGSLERRIMEGPVDAAAALRWLKQLASALGYLHGRGIRHRDIKPSNILISSKGDATLVDFGIATEADGGTLSESGQAMGSVGYVPPEWVHAGMLDPVKWDFYALGVCAYEVLTGAAAFGVPSGGMSTQRFYQVLTAKQGHPPLDPGTHVPYALRTLVRDLTRSNPDERLAAADKVLARLDEVDLTDIRPELVFEAGLVPLALHLDAAAPSRHTMVPDGPVSNTPANATTSPEDFESKPFVRPSKPPALGEPARILAAEAAAAPPAPAPAARPRVGGAIAIGAGLFVIITAAWGVGRLTQDAPTTPVATTLSSPTAAPKSVATPSTSASITTASPVATAPAAAPGVAAPPAVATPSKPIAKPGPPAAKPPPQPAITPPPAPTPDAPVTVKSPGAAVTSGQLSRWLAKHPDWQRDAALAAGKVDDKYLRNWEGATPPAGKEAAPAVAVTWSLAAAYCGGRGGLAAVDAPPLTWTEGAAQPWMEYRQEGGKPRWRRDDGGVSAAVDPAQSGAFIGFRCAE